MEESTDIGRRLRKLRQARGKSLAVIAGLAGISMGHLSHLERGERALDRRSLIVALANALEIAPTELSSLAAATPGEVREDAALDEIRRALLAVGVGLPGGEVVPAETLSTRVATILDAQQRCQHADVGEALPTLIRDLHTTLDAGRDDHTLLRLVPLLHVQGTQAWLPDVGGPLDLGWQATQLARSAAERLDEPIPRGIAAFGTAHGLVAAGAFDLAENCLPNEGGGIPAEGDGLELAGMLTFTRALLESARGNRDTSAGLLDEAAGVAAHTGEGNAFYFAFGPTNVDIWRMSVALESGDHAGAATTAARINPAAIQHPKRAVVYWSDYGRALAKMRGRQPDAVTALRRAESIDPVRVHRHPFTRQTLAELLTHAKRDAAGRELRGMAYRAGLSV